MAQEKLAVDELLWAGTLPAEDFADFLHAYRLPPEATTLMLLEAQPRHVIKQDQRQDLLHFASFDAAFDFTPYTAGRIFHDLGELRWERQQAAIQLVYTGYKEYKPERLSTDKYILDKTVIAKRKYFLFGKRLDNDQLKRIGSAAQEGDFAEVRIPRLLRYPTLEKLQGAERIQLVMCEYRDAQTGQNVAYRCKELVHYTKPKKKQE